ncbi:MAG: CU044_5270 family protein [Actinocatenispora sp.]
MSATPRRRHEPLDPAELSRLLPAPADPTLSADRHLLLKEHLLNEIQQTNKAPAATGRRRWRLALAAPVAVAAVAAVTIGLVVHGAGSTAEHPKTGAHQQASSTPAASDLLGRISLVAAHEPAIQVRDDQFVYVDSKVAFARTNGDTGETTMDTPHRRQIWLAADGSQPGFLKESKTGRSLDPNPNPTLNNPTYKYLITLPTDPDALLRKIYADTKDTGSSPDDEAFVTIGDLLHETLVPPNLAAALYRAAAKIPGVTVVKDAADAVGRHGVAVSWTTEHGGRDQWIFDRKSLRYLGERDLAGTGVRGVKPGTVTGTTAVLHRGVVDKVRQLPN